MDKIKIGQAAEMYGLEKRTFQKRLISALNSPKRRDIFSAHFPDGAPENTGLNDDFTPELRAFWESWTGGKTDVKPKTATLQMTETDAPKKVEIPVSVPDSENSDYLFSDMPKISDMVFSSEILLILALIVLIFSDGYSMSILAGRAISANPVTLGLFGVVGVIIGYAAIKNAWTLSRQDRKRWEKGPITQWIVVFSIFQAALHGAAFQLFSGWGALNPSDLVGRILICISIPLGTASLTATILKK